MFERLYTRPVVISQHCTGPLAEERIAYVHHLMDRGRSISYLRDTAAYLLVIARRLNLANRPGEHISTDEVEGQAALWAARVNARDKSGGIQGSWKVDGRRTKGQWMA